MRILSICPDTGIDVLGAKGAAIHVREMVTAFRSLGHEVELVAPRLTKPGVEPATPLSGVRRIRVPDDVQAAKQALDEWLGARALPSAFAKDVRRMLYDAELEAQLLERFGNDPPDLVYVRASLLSTAGVALSRRTGCPLVVEYNAPLSEESARYRGSAVADMATAVERELLAAATVVVVVSAGIRDHVVALGADPWRVLVLPNAVDPARFRPAASTAADRARLGLPPGPLLGFVGGLRPWHGVEHLPAVLERVRRSHPGARLVIAGDGPMRAPIEDAALALGVRDAVTLLGAVRHDDMPDVIRAFDVALAPYPQLPHDFYFSPLKVFEYLGCGVPVVASAAGQLAELLTHRDDALLTPPGDLDALAAACASLLAAPDEAAAMASRGATHCHARYTWAGNARAVLAAVGERTSSLADVVTAVR